MAETLLDVLRGDQGFTHDEAMLLDVMLMLHAEHGGGNNSTFTTPRALVLGHGRLLRLRGGHRLPQGPAPRRRQRQGGLHA